MKGSTNFSIGLLNDEHAVSIGHSLINEIFNDYF